MSPEKKKNVIQAIISAVISILTALLASSCTLVIVGNRPWAAFM